MRRKKTLQDLTIRDNFMFSAAMMIGDNCRQLLERVLDQEIRSVTVDYERSLVYNPEYKGIRMDVFAEDNANTCYNVEMQVVNREIFKRSRYYHSQMDMDKLVAGKEYENLPDTYVIFICDFDPFGLKKYRYTLRTVLEENRDRVYDDGTHTIFLNTKGKNETEVPESLVNFLWFVGGKQAGSHVEDTFVEQLEKTVAEIKRSREMGERYMLFEEMLRDEFRAGEKQRFQNTVNLFLMKHGDIPETLADKLESITDIKEQDRLIQKAAYVSSIEEFMQELEL